MVRVLLAAFAASVALCGAAQAGPCEQLAGARWVYYMEGPFGSPGQSMLATGTVDFRRGVNGMSLATMGQTPFPALTQSQVYGQSTISRVTGCQLATAQGLPANTALLGDLSGGSSYWTVSADGRSAALVGAHVDSVNMRGRALRVQ